MILEINLLPEELRKKELRPKKMADAPSIDLKKLPYAKITVTIVLALIAIHVGLFVFTMLVKAGINRMETKIKTMSVEKKESLDLQTQVEIIQKKVAAIDTLMLKRFSWAKKLNALGDSVTPGIWLSELSYEEKQPEKLLQAPKGQKKDAKVAPVTPRYLTISGCASSMGDAGTAAIGKFIKSLNDNQQFYADFKDIVLGTIVIGKYEDQEVMNFKITCVFKESD